MKGTTAKPISTVAMIAAGAMTKTGLSAKAADPVSKNIFRSMSATGCKSPKGPTRSRPVAVLEEAEESAFERDEVCGYATTTAITAMTMTR